MIRTTLENRPDVIRSRIDPLWSRIEEGQPVSGRQRAAVAEGFFRIGVHPGTAPAEALRLLARAHRLDNSNPKYPYHAGLIYLRHGQLEPAAAWLSAAASLSPANHRIWAHVALTSSGLHHRQQDEPGYTDNKHRERARFIAETIRDGRHDFDPAAKRPLPPLLRPGQSRWPGICDITAEDQLRSPTAERVRDDLAADLKAVAEQASQASRRKGRTAALTVLAVQWLVYGYHPAAIRRIIDALPADGSPAYRLLDLICGLFEADRAELPARLAACLAEGTLPDTLVALIHRQRLFWRPLQFPDLGAHTAARQFTGGDPSRHERALREALNKLSADPPDPVADARPEVSPELSPGERFALIERSAGQLYSLLDRVNDQVKALAEQQKQIDSEASFARALGDHEILTALRDRWEESRQAWLAECQRFQNPTPDPATMNMLSEDFITRMTACESKLQRAFGNKPLTKSIGPALGKRSEFAAVAPAPSVEALSLADAMSAIPDVPSNSAPPATRPQSPAHVEVPFPPPADDEYGRVMYVLDAAERRHDANFTEAWRTLDAYPPEFRDRPAVLLLRSYLSGHQAESDLRLGRTSSALRCWNAMLADDPVHPAVLRNLAVAHTTSGDPAQATRAWRRYLEALYLEDLLRGDVRRGAAERAQVHRILAGSFGTAALTAGFLPESQPEETVRQVPLVLSSVSKVSIAIAHLRLEELNHFLSYRSPALLLGTSRTAGEQDLADAKDAREASVRAAVKLLPERLRTAFQKLCLRTIDGAYQEASKTSGRTRRPSDEAEEQAHAKWARDRVLWKERLVQAIVSPEGEWALTGFSGEVISNLRLIDALPLDVKDEALLRSIQQMGRTDGDPATKAQRYNELSDIACNHVVGQIVKTAHDLRQDGFPSQFRSAGRSWARNPVPDSYLDLLDDPQSLYLQSVRTAFDVLKQSGVPADDHERSIVADAVAVMSRWAERLPGATGPGCLLARFLESLDRYDEAEDVLSRTGDDAFSPRGHREIALSSARLNIARGRFADAVNQVRELVSADPEDERPRNLLIQAYNRWITSGENIPEPVRITADLARWTDAETVKDRRILTMNAAMARHKARGEDASVDPLVAELRTLYAEDSGNTELHYHLTTALYQLAMELRGQVRRSSREQRQALREQLERARAECETYGNELLRTGTLRKERIESIRQILRAIRSEPR